MSTTTFHVEHVENWLTAYESAVISASKRHVDDMPEKISPELKRVLLRLPTGKARHACQRSHR